jgi:hypothetical protein
MNKAMVFLATAAPSLLFASAAMAGDVTAAHGNVTIQQASQILNYSGGNERMRVEISPNYSEELGWTVKGAAGSYLTDDIALGLIVEYGQNKKEYLGNAGIQFNDALSLVGSVGMLQEDYEYIPGDGRKSVQQMEYGASLTGAYEVGIFSGFELNGYLTNADAGSKTVETGDLYGVQLLANFDLTDTTHVKLGGGYEWLEWADGDNNDSVAFSAEGRQQLGDMLSLNATASVGASENVYGAGLALDLSPGGFNTNRLALNYNYIDGKDGIQDDQRVELGWTYGFGAGPAQVASAETQDTGAIRPTADVATMSPVNNLLGDVMKRPAYLPQTVIARAAKVAEATCPYEVVNFSGLVENVYYQTEPAIVFIHSKSGTYPTNTTVNLGGTFSNWSEKNGGGDYYEYRFETAFGNADGIELSFVSEPGCRFSLRWAPFT